MPATPDRDTLRLRRPDRRPPAEAVALARRELARRPAATLADVRLSAPDRALVSFRERYPAVAERFYAGVLWATAHGHAHPGQPARHPCGWDLARAWSRRYGGPALRVDPLGRRLLGDPCPGCQAALGWHPPKPKPKPKPAARTSRSTRTRSSAARTSTRRPAAAAALVASTRPRLSRKRAAENAAACWRMGMDPARWPHLTRPAP
jgi:hypothetical protein